MVEGIILESDEEKNNVWRIRAGSSTNRGGGWLNNGVISIGWGEVGDLNDYLDEKGEMKEDELKLVVENAKKENNYYQSVKHIRDTLVDFHSEIVEDDLVIASKEGKLYGIGRVKGRYRFRPDLLPNDGHPHIRKVNWIDDIFPTQIDISELKSELNSGPYQVYAPKTLQKVKKEKQKHTIDLLRIDKKGILSSKIVELIENKKQIILYGPPGTGKTYKTKKISIGLLSGDKK